MEITQTVVHDALPKPSEHQSPEHQFLTADQSPQGQPVGRALPGWRPVPAPTGQPLRGTRVSLCRLDPGAHIPALHAAAQADRSGASWTYLPYGPFASLAEHLAWAHGRAGRDDPLLYAVVDAQQDVLGHAAFMRVDGTHGVIEIGHVYFAPALQRTAAATEALGLMLAAAFEAGYRRVEWKCNALNAPSRRAAERLGFRYEGTFHQAQVVKGRNRDTAWYALLDADWPRCARALEAWLSSDNFDSEGRQRASLQALRAGLPPGDGVNHSCAPSCASCSP